MICCTAYIYKYISTFSEINMPVCGVVVRALLWEHVLGVKTPKFLWVWFVSTSLLYSSERNVQHDSVQIRLPAIQSKQADGPNCIGSELDTSCIFFATPPFVLVSTLRIFPVLRYAVSLGVVIQGWVTRLSPAGQGKVIFDWFSSTDAFSLTPTEAERASLTRSILIPPKFHLQDSLSLQMWGS